MSSEIRTVYFKEYEELKFSDDFMFCKTMEDTKLCHDLIECLLQRPIGELQESQIQKEYKFTSDGKPIRLDVYNESVIPNSVENGEKEIFNTEMQNLNKHSLKSLELPKRSRFYQASIDIDFLRKKHNFKLLPMSHIIFICTFDPFGRGEAKYTFDSKCRECPDLVLGDGTEKHFFNCAYEGENIPEDLGLFYEYIRTGDPKSELTDRIHEAVFTGRKNEEWRSQYMKEQIIIEEALEEERKRTEAERQRAETERQRAETEKQRAETEKQRADYYYQQLIDAGITPADIPQ